MLPQTPSLIKKSVLCALLLMGCTSVITQVLIIRELWVTFSGNELSIGLITANWLVLEAIGSSLIGRIVGATRKAPYARAHAEPHAGVQGFAALQLLISICLPLAVYATRVARNLIGIVPGEEVGLLPILYCSFLILAPLSLSDGAQFTVGCKILSALSKEDASSIGKVYIYEAIGFILGGIGFTYLLIPHFHSIQIAFSVSVLNLFSALFLLISFAVRVRRSLTPLRRPLTLAVILCCGLALYLLSSSRTDDLHTRSIHAQWKGHDLLYYGNSIYGNVTVTQREQQLTFFADGLPIATTPAPDIVYVEELVHLPLLFHASPKRVLLVSGGIGGVLTEILKHPVENVDYTELDPLIIQAAQKFKTTLSETELTDPRVHVEHVDGRLFIKTTPHRYDVVIANLPAPFTLQINRFYTVEFFQMVHRILAKDGILLVVSPGSLTYMSKELRDLNACIHHTLQKAFAYVRIIPGDTVLFVASPSDRICTVTPSVLAQRLKERRIDTKLLTDFHVEYKLGKQHVTWFLESLEKSKDVRVNKDLLPSGLFYHLSLWTALSSPNLKEVLRWIGKLNLWVLLIPIIASTVVLIMLRTRIPGLTKIPIPIAIATTGFTGMTLDIVLILAFQAFYGYVYHQLALLVTAFMIGLTVGSLLMIRFMGRIKQDRLSLAKIDLIIGLYCVSLPVMLVCFNAYIAHPLVFSSVRVILLLLSTISGFLVGSQFPLANKSLLNSPNSIGRVAGILYASDLFGSCIAGLATSVALIPVLGMLNTCLLVFAMKLACVALLQHYRRRNPPAANSR